MTSRRRFLQSAAAGSLLASSGRAATGRAAFRYDEIEAKIARRDFRGITKQDLGTPSMILDLDLFQKNLNTMASHSKATGLSLRPHVKIHKSPDVSKRQIALGASGVTCATIAEAELMVAAGIRNALLTGQPAGVNKIGRAAALAKKDPTFTVAVDDPRIAEQLEEACAAAGSKLNIMTDVHAGLTRQGCRPGETALKLAQKIDSSKNLKLAGLMGYSGNASHTKGWEERKKKSQDDLAGLLESVALCRRSGMEVKIITGGSTGTYNIDVGSLTELQCGSYVFMDTIYRKIGGKSDAVLYADFDSSLTVMTTVISKTRPNVCSIDCGNKALLRPTDQVKGHPGVKIENQGAEYGLLLWNDGDHDFQLGDRVEIYPSNLDMSTNVYDRYYVARGEQIVDVWPIMGRSGAVQR